jgi:purine-nucleoside phosphorylase
MEKALNFIGRRTARRASIGIILGSGLGALTDSLEDAEEIETREIPGYPTSTVEGHRGQLLFGRLGGVEVAVVRGRVHMYEGYSARDVVFPVRLLHALGVRRLIVTNAAGGINPEFRPGTLMFIHDHINFAFANPLVGPNDGGGPRFPDMSAPYDIAWLEQAEAVAKAEGIETRRGVYLWTMGPSYETKAEVEAFRRLGADAAGMSTVPEVIEAVYLGMSVLGLSTITNLAAGLSTQPLTHDEVMQVGRESSEIISRLFTAIVAAVPLLDE